MRNNAFYVKIAEENRVPRGQRRKVKSWEQKDRDWKRLLEACREMDSEG